MGSHRTYMYIVVEVLECFKLDSVWMTDVNSTDNEIMSIGCFSYTCFYPVQFLCFTEIPFSLPKRINVALS